SCVRHCRNSTLLSRLLYTSIPYFFFSITRPQPTSTLFPYTTLFRSIGALLRLEASHQPEQRPAVLAHARQIRAIDGFGLMRSLRSEEHTSELQSRGHLVCRLLLEKKKRDQRTRNRYG